jgi:hypothetical protein
MSNPTGSVSLKWGVSISVADIVAVSQEDADRLVATLRRTQATPELYQGLLKYEYVGLNLDNIRKHWLLVGRDQKWSLKVLVTKIREVIGVGFYFGNVTDNNFKKRTSEGQAAIVDLLQKCRIVANVTEKNKQNACTIGRTMAAFPRDSCLMAARLGRDFTDGPGGRELTRIPKFMKCVAFAGAMYTTEPVQVGELLEMVFLIWSANMNLVINRAGATKRNRVWTAEQYENSALMQSTFVTIAWGSDKSAALTMKKDLKEHGFTKMYNLFMEICRKECPRIKMEVPTCTKKQWAEYFADEEEAQAAIAAAEAAAAAAAAAEPAEAAEEDDDDEGIYESAIAEPPV